MYSAILYNGSGREIVSEKEHWERRRREDRGVGPLPTYTGEGSGEKKIDLGS